MIVTVGVRTQTVFDEEPPQARFSAHEKGPRLAAGPAYRSGAAYWKVTSLTSQTLTRYFTTSSPSAKTAFRSYWQ